MARDYELGIIINPDVGDEQARTTVERVTQYVTTGGGQVVRVNAQGRRHLAYPIEHHRDGLYFWFDLILAPESVSGLERTIGVNEVIIRHLVKLRDPRVIQQVRQREADADAQAAAQAAARAAHDAEVAAQAAAPSAPVESATPAESTPPAESATLPDEQETGGDEDEAEADDVEEDEAEVESTGVEAEE